MPRVGRRYVFFVKGNPELDYQIITAYELSNGRVYPLDKSTSSDTKFEIHTNTDELLFLNKLRKLSQTVRESRF